MAAFSFVLLYVDKPETSAAFYAGLLGQPVLESSATFAMLPLCNGVRLGLWSRHTVTPAATAGGGGAEIALTVADADVVKAMYADWRNRGVTIAQAPTALDFGFTFVALDPDAHRIRVFAPGAV